MRNVMQTSKATWKVVLSRILERARPHGGAGEKAVMAGFAAIGKSKGYSVIEEPGYVEICIPGNDTVLFCAHADTVDKLEGRKTLVWEGDTVSSPRSACLGADDGAGIFVLSAMLHHGVPGYYALFAGEEVGCVGVESYSPPADVSWCIEFDRQGTSEVIYNQMGQDSARYEDAMVLSGILNDAFRARQLLPSDNGVYTDNARLIDDIPACVNIAVGYERQHTSMESLNTAYLFRLVEACCRADWLSLPIPAFPDRFVYQKGWDRYGEDRHGDSLFDYICDEPEEVYSFLQSCGITLADLKRGYMK